MPRPSTLQRYEQLVSTAATMFTASGYRATRLADIAAAMGVTEAALYRYVESKEALFDRVVRRAADPGRMGPPDRLPIATPEEGATLAFLRTALQDGARIDSLERALDAAPGRGAVRAELEAIVQELFETTMRYRVGLKIVERSAAEWPELAALWFGSVRARLLDRLASYVDDRARGGMLRPIAHPRVSARLIVETIAFFAMHRHEDPFPTPMDDAVALETVIDALCHAYVPDDERALER